MSELNLGWSGWSEAGVYPAGGVCGAGGGHARTDAQVITLDGHESENGEPGYKQCARCQGIFAAAGGAGVCPAGHEHDARSDEELVVRME